MTIWAESHLFTLPVVSRRDTCALVLDFSGKWHDAYEIELNLRQRQIECSGHSACLPPLVYLRQSFRMDTTPVWSNLALQLLRSC
ncbi:MAG: hypothetical protein CMJ84_03960 [Planctomycetes bacterium]|nr:hypothetical protein [Planctomycetota bacterium]